MSSSWHGCGPFDSKSEPATRVQIGNFFHEFLKNEIRVHNNTWGRNNPQMWFQVKITLFHGLSLEDRGNYAVISIGISTFSYFAKVTRSCLNVCLQLQTHLVSNDEPIRVNNWTSRYENWRAIISTKSGMGVQWVLFSTRPNR